ncbi:MAG: hypothetical protein KDN22_16425 [Verrucomicrobiae bacterium]|nr:hypothetical protein [Verrucomicrobiae bacterium]
MNALRFVLPLIAYCCIGAVAGGFVTDWRSSGPSRAASFPSMSDAVGVQSKDEDLLDEGREILAENAPFRRRLRLYKLVQKANLHTLPELLESCPEDVLSRQMIATRWAALDPLGLAEYLDADINRYDWSTELALFETWATTDPEVAWDYVREHPGYRRTNYRAQAAMESILHHDLEAGMRLIAQHPDSLESIGWNRFKGDPARAAQLIADLPECTFKESSLPKMIAAWSEQDSQAAVDWVDQNSNASEREQNFAWVFDGIIASDLPLAMEIFEQSENRELRTDYAENIAISLAQQDPVSAMDWISKNLSGNDRKVALSSAVDAIGDKDPLLAAELIATLPSEFRPVNSVARQLYGKDPDAALQWIAELESQSEQRGAFGMLGNEIFHSQSAESLVELLKLNPDNATMSAMAVEIAHSFPGADGLRWAEQLPPVHGQQMTRELFMNWANTAPDSAIETLAAGRVPDHLRTTALSGFAAVYFRDEPAAATEWAKGMLSMPGNGNSGDLVTIRRAIRIAEMPVSARAAALAALPVPQ